MVKRVHTAAGGMRGVLLAPILQGPSDAPVYASF
jgi:hypothetical protein